MKSPVLKENANQKQQEKDVYKNKTETNVSVLFFHLPHSNWQYH